ncbi:MAG: hypothetical protein GY839_01110 [candidate division Zixibacteria bacterium]|nr:hypothetical protein [candidate division Zixibacteria bacterium]
MSSSQNDLNETGSVENEKPGSISKERLDRFKKAFEAKWLKEKIENTK